MSMSNFQEKQAARAEAYEKARAHLLRASAILEGIGKAAGEGAFIDPTQALAILEQAKAEALTGQGWAALANTPPPAVTRGGGMTVDQLHFNP